MFGFKQELLYPMDDGRVGHAELSYAGNLIYLASEFEGFGSSPARLSDTHSGLYWLVDDADAHHARTLAAGATIVTPPVDAHGMRLYRALDTEGHRWTFATPFPAAGSEPMSAAEKLDETFLALADPARRKVIELLRKKPRRAGDLAAALDMVPPAMSRHLRILRASGLVEEEALPDDARVRVYRLRAEPFSELRLWLDEVEAFWSDQLQAFKAHAERTPGPRVEAHPRVREQTREAHDEHGNRENESSSRPSSN